MRIAIIGTAGRGATGSKMTIPVYNSMFKRAIEAMSHIPPAERFLVSGGAAWSDHIAVSLFLAGVVGGLELYLPTHWCGPGEMVLDGRQPPCFQDTGERDWRHNPGGTMNYYHALFSRAIGKDTLQGIQTAIDQGAVIHDQPLSTGGSAFHARNLQIGAGLDLLIAFSWGSGLKPVDGGTAHCWENSNAKQRIHVALEKVHKPLVVQVPTRPTLVSVTDPLEIP